MEVRLLSIVGTELFLCGVKQNNMSLIGFAEQDIRALKFKRVDFENLHKHFPKRALNRLLYKRYETVTVKKSKISRQFQGFPADEVIFINCECELDFRILTVPDILVLDNCRLSNYLGKKPKKINMISCTFDSELTELAFLA